MSIKSLLQLILLLLIFLIIGGIYFFYFYTGNNIQVFDTNNISKNEQKMINQDNETVEEVLEDIKIDNSKVLDDNKEQINNKTKVSFDSQKNSSNKIIQTTDNNETVENLTKEIEYVTSNSKGDIFKIIAKSGKTNLNNTNILDLDQVDGIISSLERTEIYIESDHAKYNYTNQNSKFYKNVVVKYDNKVMTCDNFDLNAGDNIAVAYGNVIIKDDKSIMKAQIVTMDTITKDIKINSDEKVKIFTN